MDHYFIALESSPLAQKIADGCGAELHQARFRTFADGEISVTLPDHDALAGKTVFIVQSTGDPVNKLTLGVAFLAHELKNAGAARVVAVLPYLGYARHDQSSVLGKVGNIAVIAQLFQGAGIDELITVDLHEPSVIDSFSIPVHNVQVASLIAQHIESQRKSMQSTCLIAPDHGASEYVQKVADTVGVGTIIFSKERFAADQTRTLGHEGHCSGTTAIILDDIIATGGTAVNVCNALPALGFKNVYGYFVHPVLAGPALERIAESAFLKIFVSNTLSLSKEALESPKIEVFDVSAILIDTINALV